MEGYLFLFCFSPQILFCSCFLCFPASLLLCFSAFPASLLFCFSAFSASLLFLLLCFLLFLLFAFPSSLLFMLLYFSTLPASFLPVCILNETRKTLGETQRNPKEILIRTPDKKPLHETLKNKKKNIHYA